MRRVRRTVSIDFRTKKQLELWGEINMRGIIRLIYMFIRRPKEALFVTGIILVFPAVILIYFGVRYAMGSVAPVDLNNRNCDFTQVTDYTHVSGYVYDAWGHFTIPENNSTCFYIIPKFNDDTNPEYIEKVLVIAVENEDSKAWNSVTNDTKRWFTRSSPKTGTPIKVDKYARSMGENVKNGALGYLQECGFSYEGADKVLVPYLLFDDSSAMYKSFGFGILSALLSLICFGIWIAKGANFRR